MDDKSTGVIDFPAPRPAPPPAPKEKKPKTPLQIAQQATKHGTMIVYTCHKRGLVIDL